MSNPNGKVAEREQPAKDMLGDVKVETVHKIHNVVLRWVIYDVRKLLRDMIKVSGALKDLVHEHNHGRLPVHDVYGHAFQSYTGLCSTTLCLLPSDVRAELFGSWAGFSGDYPFPVSDPDDSQDEDYGPAVSYCNSRNKYTGAYGAARVDLARHCAAVLDAYITWLRVIFRETSEHYLMITRDYLTGFSGNCVPNETIDGDPLYRGFGLCMNAFTRLHETRMIPLIQAWPEYSGVPTYPVPSEVCPVTAYTLDGDKWSGEYGCARIRLAGYVRDSITAYLALEDLA